MARLIVRDVDDEVVEALKIRAAQHGRSAESEHREILRDALLGGRGRRRSLKQFLLSMPDVGDDSDFARSCDSGRDTRL